MSDLILKRLEAAKAYFDAGGRPTMQMQIFWQQTMEAIEAQDALQNDAIADIQAALALANANAQLTQALVEAASTPPVSGGTGGGTSDSDTSFAPFSLATHSQVSNELVVTAGTGGTVTLTADGLAVSTAAMAPTGTFDVYGKWQWDSTGTGVWVDVGTEDVNTSPASVESEASYFSILAGNLTCNEVKTGLTPATVYKFRFMARNSSGTRTMYLTGTVSAVGS